MDTDTAAALLFCLSLCLGIVVVAFHVRITVLSEEVASLKGREKQLQHALTAYKNYYQENENKIRAVQTKNNDKLLVDQRTYNLIALAVNNSNDNEARSAALQACKRIVSQIGKK